MICAQTRVRGVSVSLAVLADPAHPEHAERIDWIGEEFDPHTFDIATANIILAARFGIN
jgi:hypothetical protein